MGWAALPLLQPPRPTDCQYSPHHNHRIRRPLGRVQGGDGCQVSSCSHKLQTTRYTASSIQPEYLQTVSNARDNGQVRAMNGIYKSDSSLITLLLALCIPGVACAVCACVRCCGHCEPSQGLFSGPKINTSCGQTCKQCLKMFGMRIKVQRIQIWYKP